MKNHEIVKSVWMTATAETLLNAYEGWVKDGQKHIFMGMQSYWLVYRSPMRRKLDRLGLVEEIRLPHGRHGGPCTNCTWPVLTQRGRVITRLLLHKFVKETGTLTREEVERDFKVRVR